MKKQILMIITVCVIVVSSFVSCDGDGESQNWMYFTSTGTYDGSITRFRHSWYNRTTVTLEVRYLDDYTYIYPGQTVAVIISGTKNSWMNCKVHAEDNRELKIESDGFEVIFYDK
jgi:hypothetical protein